MKLHPLLRRSFALLLLFFFLAAPAAAQRFKWWQSERYQRELGLTQEQSRRLEEIFQKSLPSLNVQKKAFDDAEKEFERLVQLADDNAVLDQVSRVEAARSELNKSRTLMLLRMRRALTTDQWVKLGALQAADERGRGHDRGK